MIKTIESHKFYRNCWHYWHWYEFENRRKERKTTESGNTGLKLFVYKREWQQQLFRRSQTEQKTESEVVMHWYCWECVSVSASVWACVCMGVRVYGISIIHMCMQQLIDRWRYAFASNSLTHTKARYTFVYVTVSSKAIDILFVLYPLIYPDAFISRGFLFLNSQFHGVHRGTCLKWILSVIFCLLTPLHLLKRRKQNYHFYGDVEYLMAVTNQN